jgi:putative ubiquitin-RnfH superfamily antitoxin RatB of RatAB toxin-antitoxin module
MPCGVREMGFAPAASADLGCLAVFGRAVTLATALHPGDRIELLRPLLADPKQRRRERAGRGPS